MKPFVWILSILVFAQPMAAAELPFAQATTKAWEAAGARPSVLLIDSHFYASTSPYLDTSPNFGPGFYVERWQPGQFRDLPPPEKPFFISIDGGRATDETLDEIKGCKNLVTLIAYGDKVTDAGLAKLAGLEKLQRLHLGGSGISDEGLKHIATLPALEALSIVNNENITVAGVRELIKIKSLRVIDLTDTKLAVEAVEALAKHKHLSCVRFSSNELKPEHYTAFQSFPALEALCIAGSWTDDVAVQHVAKIERLRELDCSLAPVHDETVKVLARMPNLEKLSIWNDPITDDGVALFQTFPKLTHVWISGRQLTDRSLRELAKVKTLKHANITATSMTDEGLREFFKARPDVQGSVNLLR
jgi:hypothetical protein